MKQTKFFDIEVPELGDRPDITKVSEAIQDLEDTLAGTVEYMEAQSQGGLLSLTSATRATKRIRYHNGLTLIFTTKTKLDIGSITEISVDGLPPQPAELKFIINQDDSAIVVFDGTKFAFKHAPMPRSNDINSNSEHLVATSRAVKTVNDKKAEKTVQVIAGNGLTGGGALEANVSINVVADDSSIVVSDNGIKVNTINAVNSTDAIRPASANSVKTAYDKGVEAKTRADQAYQKAVDGDNSLDNKKVNKAGDIMTGALKFTTAATSSDTAAQGQIGYGLMSSYGPLKILANTDNSTTDEPVIIASAKGLTTNKNDGLAVGKDYLKWLGNDIYHTGNKPSKADVGLSNVQNWTATSSVSDSANDKYATAGAVKQAYDRASSGINEANAKVSKSGDTMTGNIHNNSGAHLEGLNIFTRGGNLSTTGAIVGGIQANWFDNVAKFGICRGAGVDIPIDGLRFKLNNNTYKVFHEGFKPTASDVGAISKYGDTMTGNLTISTGNYPSLFLNNITSGYNKALRIEHSQANRLRFIKYTDIGAGTQDKALDWDMSSGGVIYHTGNKPSANDIGAVSKSGDTVTGQLNTSILIDNATNIGRTSTGLLTIPAGGWAKPIGFSQMIHTNSSGFPSGNSYGYWNILGRRDSSGGYTGLLSIFDKDRVYLGRGYASGDNPTWSRIYTDRDKPTYSDVGAIGGLRLGTAVSRQVWNSSQSNTEDKGYVTVAVRNSNADNHVDTELRRPLQALVNGSWVTVATI